MGFDKFLQALIASALYAFSLDEDGKTTMQAFKSFMHGWIADQLGVDELVQANSFVQSHPDFKHAKRDWLAGYEAAGIWREYDENGERRINGTDDKGPPSTGKSDVET